MNFEQSFRFDALESGSVASVCGFWKAVHVLGRPKYVDSPALSDQLFDLVNDPQELSDVAINNVERMQLSLALLEENLRVHAKAEL